MIEENWKAIEGYEGLYEVSSLGRVRSVDRMVSRDGHEMFLKGRLLKPYKSREGYLLASLSKDGQNVRFLVHRLVAQAFITNPEQKPAVDHINTIKDDNRVENLQWVTTKENTNNPITLEHRKGLNKGRKHSDETKKKMSEQHKGRKHSDETKKKMSESHVGMSGKHHSDETKKKMSESHVGMSGKHHSEETKKKISESRKKYFDLKRLSA